MHAASERARRSPMSMRFRSWRNDASRAASREKLASSRSDHARNRGVDGPRLPAGARSGSSAPSAEQSVQHTITCAVAGNCFEDRAHGRRDATAASANRA